MQSKSFRYLVIILAVAIFSNLVYGIHINEVSPRGPEFVEVYNINNEIINLSEWYIKDASNSTDNIVCENIPNCSLIINFTYFIIIGNNTLISEITAQPINYFYVDDSTVADNLNDGGDNITFFNSTYSSSFYYNYSEANKSWQFYNETWQLYIPTPGTENTCSSQSCVQNWSCTGWGSCTSGSQTRTCTDLSNCSNSTGKPSESQSCNSGVSVDLDYDHEVTNGEEFEVKVDARNLKDEEYDIKVFIYDDNPNSPISEIYSDADEKWQSGYNYLMNIIEGSGDKEITFKLRIDSDEDSFSGDANISVKVRDDAGNVVANMTDDISIAEMEEDDEEEDPEDDEDEPPASASTTNTANSADDVTAGVIKLGSKQENIKTSGSKVLYKSDTEYFKEYGIYGLAFICVIAIVGFLIKPNQNGKNKKHRNT